MTIIGNLKMKLQVLKLNCYILIMAILSVHLLELTQPHANIPTVSTTTSSPGIVKGGGNISIVGDGTLSANTPTSTNDTLGIVQKPDITTISVSKGTV